MKINKNTSRTINLVFILYLVGYFSINYAQVIIGMFKEYNSFINSADIINHGDYLKTNEIIIGLLITFIITLFITIFNNTFIIILYVGVKLGLRHVKKERLSDIDFGKYKDYYRDILKNYNPMVLSFIDDYEIGDKDVVATLLSLKYRGYINIENNTIINTNTDNNLNDIDKYLIENTNNYNINIIKQLVIKETISKGLIESSLDIKRKVKKKIVKLLIGFISIYLVLKLIFDKFSFIFDGKYVNENNIIILVFVLLLLLFAAFFLVLYPFISVLYLLTYSLGKAITPYKRTNKGNEINEKLEGLKNYLKDFGTFEDKVSNEVVLWNEYLIYSVLFNQNKGIVEEFNSLR